MSQLIHFLPCMKREGIGSKLDQRSLRRLNQPHRCLQSQTLLEHTRREKRKHEEQKLLPRPHISLSSETELSHRPSFESSNGSGGQRSWKALQLNGWAKVYVDQFKYCTLEAGHRNDDRLYTINAVYLHDSSTATSHYKMFR
ncbi:hypothetical protein RJZ90_000910 [Blastomyces dermatitidis]